jgi:hypothetical protein
MNGGAGRRVAATWAAWMTAPAFLIPAQRVLVLQDGWPKPFMGYSVGDPYAMRRFSDSLRQLMENGLDATGGVPIFPCPRRMKYELQTVVDESIYIGAKLVLETEGLRKRIMLAPKKGSPALPYSAWSAGQREFTPLLLGLYWLMPPAKTSRRGSLSTVIIEEPEMGLHPRAIIGFGLLMLELLYRGYRVVLSTHSPVILDIVWAIRELRQVPERRAMKALDQLFGLEHPSWVIKYVLRAALEKEYRTYFFDRRPRGVVTLDISSLDPGDTDQNVAGWGGLSGFSGRTAEIVGAAITRGRARPRASEAVRRKCKSSRSNNRCRCTDTPQRRGTHRRRYFPARTSHDTRGPPSAHREGQDWSSSDGYMLRHRRETHRARRVGGGRVWRTQPAHRAHCRAQHQGPAQPANRQCRQSSSPKQ